jgi:hypothetical protein
LTAPSLVHDSDSPANDREGQYRVRSVRTGEARMREARLSLVREALARTLESRTARLCVRREGSVIGIPISSDERGTIDFARCRHRIDEGERRIVVDGDAVYAQQPDGRWRRPLSGSGRQPGNGQPLWLLQMLHGAVEASPGEDGALRVVADIVVADKRSRDGVRMIPDAVLRDARRQRIDVWIEDGWVRRVRLVIPSGHVTIELDDFGGPPPIELPAEDLLVDPGLGPV